MDEHMIALLKPVIQERVKTFSEIKGWLVPFMTEPECDLEDLKYKSLDSLTKVNEVLWSARAILESVQDIEFNSKYLEELFRDRASRDGIKAGEFFFPIRVALTGSKISLPLFETMEALGKEKTLERLRKVCKRLNGGRF